MSSQNESENAYLVCCMYTIATIATISVTGLTITYYVFGIKTLIENFNDAKDCNMDLWIYVLVSIFVAPMRSAIIQSSDKEIPVYICTIICIGFMEIGMACWGGVELWENSCSELKETKLWTFGLVTFVLQNTIIFICFAIPIIYCIINKKSEANELSCRDSNIV